MENTLDAALLKVQKEIIGIVKDNKNIPYLVDQHLLDKNA